MSESVIYCEGYHDRAFWKGWLPHLGCTDPGAPLAGTSLRRPITDPWKLPVKGGHFAYHSQSGLFIRVEPCHGRANILPAVRNRLRQRNTKALRRVIINIDSDITASGVLTASSGLQQRDVVNLLREFDPAATVNANGEVDLDSGATKVSLIRWEVSDPPAPGLPDQQTLERVACTAIAAAYPDRSIAVQNWLAARSDPPPVDPKEYVWSYMAGWYAEFGCDAFYENLWNDPEIVTQLRARLEPSGAWQITSIIAG